VAYFFGPFCIFSWTLTVTCWLLSSMVCVRLGLALVSGEMWTLPATEGYPKLWVWVRVRVKFSVQVFAVNAIDIMLTRDHDDNTAQIPLGSSRLDTTRHVRCVELMHFGRVQLVEQHGSTRSTRRAREARLNLVCCIICIKLWYVSYSQIYWSIHLCNLFHLMELIGFVYVRA